MHKKRLLDSKKKSEFLPAQSYTGNVAKLRRSTSGRFSKYRTPSTHIEIRKPLNIYMIDELNKLGRKTYFQRVYILAENIEEEKLKENYRNFNSTLSDFQHPDFREYFQRHVDEIFATCEKKKCTPDHFSGFFIAMGSTHTFMMIEGAEDMLATFFEQFYLVLDQIWLRSRVFLVEDKIDETYFNCFYCRRSAAININENFPPATPSDYKLMAAQHLKIKEKVKSLAVTLSEQLKNASSLELSGNANNAVADPFCLPADPFNKLLPETQRIDLVLKANKFYRTVADFSQTYRVLQTHQDEYAFLWPIQNNYMPLDIFKRSEFDVNLTFGNYGQEEKKETKDNLSNQIGE